MLNNRHYHIAKTRNLSKTLKSLCLSGLSFWGKVTSNYYPGSRGPLSKYLIWNKPRLRFDKAPEKDLWSHKQATSFPCEKSVHNLHWVADWLFPRPQGINTVTMNLIGCIGEFHRMRLKTVCNCDVHNKPGLLFGDLGFHVPFWKCG